MRITRQNELQREYPIHVACAWMGNSPRVALEHYLKVSEADFGRASAAQAVQYGAGKLSYGAVTNPAPQKSPIILPAEFGQWAMQDSNLRLLPCKGSALTN